MSDNAPIISHNQIWKAIDSLAARSELSPSALARLAGLDPTAFNKSKRKTPEGRQRWPSTESVAKVLQATNTPLDDFVALMAEGSRNQETQLRSVPVVGIAQDCEIRFYDQPGLCAMALDMIDVPADLGPNAYGIAVGDTMMEPVYRTGDILIVDSNSVPAPGDRVVVKAKTGTAVAHTLLETADDYLRLGSIAKQQSTLQIDCNSVLWMDRIVWASQ